jgi:flagellar biosynthesis/type III secretory pathway chaperone
MSQSSGKIVAVDRLIDVLEHERAALGKGDAEAVERIAAEKERLVSVLSSIPLSGALEEPLRSKARQAKLLNESNGRVIALLGRHASARLAALLSSNPSSTYGPDGAARAGGVGRNLAAV